MSTAAVDAVPAGPVLRALANRRRTRPADVLYRLYLLALFGVPSAQIAAHAPGVPADAAAAVGLQQGLASWGPVVAALVMLGVARFSAWAGLVVPEAGEVAWVLTAPVARAGLLRPRLRRTLSIAVLAGALAGYVPAWFVVTSVEVPVAPALLAGLLGGAALGAVCAGVAWTVQASAARARAVLRSAPWVLAVLAGLGVAAQATPGVRTVLAWSGPWGWAVLPLVDAAGAPGAGGEGTAALLAATALVVTAGVVLLRADAVPLAEFARRVAPFNGVRSALFVGDARFAALVRRQAVRQLVGLPRRSLPHPHRAGLVVPWMDALGLLRSPRWAWTCVATALLATYAGNAGVATPVPGLVPLAVALLGGLVAATQAVDGLRSEHGALVGSRYLPWSPVRTMLLHLVAPGLALVTGSALGAVAALLTGADARVVGFAALGGMIAVPPLIAFAALGATAPDVDPGLLLSGGEAGATLALVQWLLVPQLALGAVGLPAMVVLARMDAGAGGPVPWLSAAAWSLAVTGVGVRWLRRRLRRTL